MGKQGLKRMFLLFLALIFIVSGCTVKTYTVIKERPDREVSGNKGYLIGDAPEKAAGKDTRTTYVFEFEFGKGTSEAVDEAVIEAAEEIEVVEE